jgi:hypothetical protein
MKRREFISGLGAVAWPVVARGAAIAEADKARERSSSTALNVRATW